MLTSVHRKHRRNPFGRRVRRGGAVLFASIALVAGATETAGAAQQPGDPQVRSGARSGQCTGHASNYWAPKTIRVLVFGEHDPNGWGVPGTEQGVREVPFREYVQDSLPVEWKADWPQESLRAGALAVKHYAWYWTQHWRGGTFNGQCFDVDDSVAYQRYIPGSATRATNDAIDSTWETLLHKNGAIANSGYRATLTGDKAEPCGIGRDRSPGLLSQWGSRACAMQGQTAEQIAGLYYPEFQFR